MLQTDNRVKLIPSSEYRNPLVSPVGQLVEIGQRGEVVRRFCSGSNVSFTFRNAEALMRSEYFLTAGHCLGDTCHLYPNADLRKWRISYDYVQGISEKLMPIYSVVEHGACSDGVDFALFNMHADSYREFGTLPIIPVSSPLHEPVMVVQHPKGAMKHYSVGVVQGVNTTKGEINHTAHTYGGSSGSPVISQNTKGMFAVHVAGNESVQKNHYAVTIQNIVANSQVLSKLGLFAHQRQPSPPSAVTTQSNVTNSLVSSKLGIFAHQLRFTLPPVLEKQTDYYYLEPAKPLVIEPLSCNIL